MRKSTENSKREFGVQAVERALKILDCFTFQKREFSLAEVARASGLNKTTALRIMSSMVRRGYLQQDSATRNYALGLRLFELGGIVFSSFSLRRAATPSMNRLQNETGATVLLGMMMEDQVLYVDKREGRGMIQISSDIGWRRPVHYGMLGPVLMAFMEWEEVERLLARDPLQKHTLHSVVDEKAFRSRLQKIRKDGYFVERQEAVEGVIGICGPVRNYTGKVVAAMGIVAMVGMCRKKSDIDRYIQVVTEACSETSSALGYLKV